MSNYNTLVARNSEEALAILNGPEPVSLVFSDVTMPGKLNGVELTQVISLKWPNVAVLLTSGAELTIETCQRFRFLQKPYRIKQLLGHLNEALLDTGKTAIKISRLQLV